MGAAGDMIASALIGLLAEPEKFLEKLNNISVPNVRYVLEKSEKCGISGNHMTVLVAGHEENENFTDIHEKKEHRHGAGIEEIYNIISSLPVSEKVKNDVKGVYNLIAKAESEVHGEKIENIHFHEVGSMDAVADIAAVSMLIDELSPDEIICSPVAVGFGSVRCAHGILPVPAPAAALLLKDIPVYAGNFEGELCTPTGAALIKYFASDFGQMPLMSVEKIGYGMGRKDFPKANCVRAFFGCDGETKKKMFELNCNVDDMTGEQIGFATDRIFEAGAAEVFTVSAGMKKNRPGIVIVVICGENELENVVKSIFKYTSTIGIREKELNRYVMNRKTEYVKTNFGEIRIKKSSGYGVEKEKYEYDDIAEIADKNNMSITEVLKEIEKDNQK